MTDSTGGIGFTYDVQVLTRELDCDLRWLLSQCTTQLSNILEMNQGLR